MSSRNARRRLEQFLQNPSCDANALSVALDVPMRDVAFHEGEATREAQSPYALRRGAQFEAALFDDNAATLRAALARAGIIASEDVTVVDLRLTRNHGASIRTLDEARDVFSRWLCDDGRPEKTHIFLAPAIDAPAADVLGAGILAPDIIVARPMPEHRWQLVIGEVKVYPDRGGHTDTSSLAATRSQAGLYLHALRLLLARDARTTVDRKGFLVLSWAGTNRPSVRPSEDLEFRARAAERGIERLRAATHALDTTNVAPSRKLSVISEAPTMYREACLSFCSRAAHCHRIACEQSAPAALGDAAVTALRDVQLDRAAALVAGATPANEQEASVSRRFAHLVSLVS